jgi:hypothetical protein
MDGCERQGCLADARPSVEQEASAVVGKHDADEIGEQVVAPNEPL